MNPIRSLNQGTIIDRRGESADKHIGNDQRFRQRHAEAIKSRIDRLIGERDIEDATAEATVSEELDTSEPTFSLDPATGDKTIVVPGNKQFRRGDKIRKSDSEAGSGNGPGNGGEGVDDFVFRLSREDMLEYLFNDLELPDLERRKLIDTDEWSYRRAGFSRSGNPSLIHVPRTYKEGLLRRIASRGALKLRLEELEKKLVDIRRQRGYGPADGSDDPEVKELVEEIDRLKQKVVPPHLEKDLRYRRLNVVAEPSSQAVMFCIMDVSGSMTEREKLIAKKFFLLLHLFLTTSYKRVNLVFIRHTHTAEEVDQQTFFYDTKSGGTVVSTAIKLMSEVVKERFDVSEWNIYCAQISDGDNTRDDSDLCVRLLENDLLSNLQYMAYMEIGEGESSLWSRYKQVADQHPSRMAIVQVNHQKEIYPVFRQLFARKEKVQR